MAEGRFSEWALLNAFDQPMFDYDGIIEVQVSSSSQVLSEPIEGGQLAAYNKTRSPDRVNVQLVVRADPERQIKALADLSVFQQGVGKRYLCKLVTPNSVIENLALENVGRTHSASHGATLLVVDLEFVTVKLVESVTSQRKQWKGKRATSAPPVNKGMTRSKSGLKKMVDAARGTGK